MEKIELHFFHGFLGLPEDWDSVVASLQLEQSIEVIQHDLWDDLNHIDELSFQTWAEYKNNKMNSRSIKKIAVGYSLGGRLLMNLNLAEFDKVLLISSHPGLKILTQKHRRLAHDLEWGARFLTTDWILLKKLWNEQEVFAMDKVRPNRSEKDFDREKLSAALQSFSLSQQKTKDEYLSTLKNKILWAYGEYDQRFALLKSRMMGLLGEKYIHEIKDSGHGCLFDQPQQIADLITSELFGE